MIKILIVEDEIPARKKLKRFLDKVKETVSVEAEIDTVHEAVSFLKTTSTIDLILSDIELLDGNAFDIYHEVQVSCPIIFTTAYDQFLMNAFESNGIEYLLKPFSFERFQKAWDKFLLLRNNYSADQALFLKLNQIIGNTLKKNTKPGFLLIAAREFIFLRPKTSCFLRLMKG